MKSLRLIGLLICLGAPPVNAADPADPRFAEEIARQDAIYKSRGAEVPDGYVINRSLLSYTQALSAVFDRALGMLRPRDRWLDIGAGRGQAILDYYTPKFDMLHFEGREHRGGKAQAVAMSIEDRRLPAWQQKADSLAENKIRYLAGRRLREYSLEELGRFQLVTDVIGGFSYTTDLARFVKMVLGLLAVNGDFYTVLADVHTEQGADKPYYEGSPYLTELVNADGSEVKICAWLKRISCVEVTCESKAHWQPPLEAFRLHKVCSDVAVPPLAALHFTAGTPPERKFRIEN